jgi:uncharacterized protein YbjT (DUF2867 family)
MTNASSTIRHGVITKREAAMNRDGVRHTNPTLVVGGTGKTGRRVVERLSARGLPVRVGSRTGTPPFDWERADTWEPALRGVRAAYITYFPDVAIPGAAETVRSFADLALTLGVRRLVLLSGRGEDEAERAEQLLRSSGADWTILRASWFAQNFSEGFLLDTVLAGEVVLPAGDVAEPFIDADDIADVAVAALTEEGHTDRLYELTGSRLLTFAEAVAEIAAATGRRIEYVQISPEAFAESLTGQGVPPDVAGLLNYLFSTVLDGRNSSLESGVRRALGREARDFSEYVRRTAATGVWSSGSVAGDVGLAALGST